MVKFTGIEKKKKPTRFQEGAHKSGLEGVEFQVLLRYLRGDASSHRHIFI